MKARVAIVAALPNEISALVNGWRGDEISPSRGVYIYESERAIVVCAGIGAERALIAAGEALARGPVSGLISAGFVGALHGRLKIGQVLHPGTVIDARTGERFVAHEGDGTVVTSPVISDVREKARLFASYGGDAVDMEGASVARVAAARKIPFRLVKAVSDENDFEIKELGKFVSGRGQFRSGAFGLFLMTRPRLWNKTLQLAHGSRQAMKALTAELRREIERQSE